MTSNMNHVVFSFFVAATLIAAPADDLVAVFDVTAKGVDLGADADTRLADYISSRVAAANGYVVVPRPQITDGLRARKAESYRECYDEACQIELGKELAAQFVLSPNVVRIGSGCSASLTMYDLRTSATHKAAATDGACDEDAVVGSFKSALTKMFPSASSVASAPSPSAPSRVEATPPSTVDAADRLTVHAHSGVVVALDQGAGFTAAIAPGYRLDFGTLAIRPELELLMNAFPSLDLLDVGIAPGAYGLVDVGPIDFGVGIHVGVVVTNPQFALFRWSIFLGADRDEGFGWGVRVAYEHGFTEVATNLITAAIVVSWSL